MLLSKDQITGAAGRNYRDVEVPGKDGTLRISSISEGQMRSYVTKFVNPDGTTKKGVNLVDMRVFLVAQCLVDEEGNRIFSDDEMEQAREIDTSLVKLLFEECQDLNGLGTVPEEAEGN